MKQLLLMIFPFVLLAQTYTFSGPAENVVQSVSGIILKKAYDRANISVNIIFQQAEASLQASNAGETDGEIARIKKIAKLYPNLRIVPVELTFVVAVAFSKDDTIKISKWSDLQDFDITIVKGTKFIEKGTKGFKKKLALGFKEAFDKLNENTTQIVVIPKKAAVKMMLRDKYCEIKSVSPVLQRLSLYHFVHKKNAHLIPIIQPILQKMKDSGEIKYINSSYLRTIH